MLESWTRLVARSDEESQVRDALRSRAGTEFEDRIVRVDEWRRDAVAFFIRGEPSWIRDFYTGRLQVRRRVAPPGIVPASDRSHRRHRV